MKKTYKSERELRARHLYKFLHHHNLFDRFIRNINNCTYSSKKDDLEQFFKNDITLLEFMQKCINISYSFTWAETLEGHKYWEELNWKETRDFENLFRDYIRMTA